MKKLLKERFQELAGIKPLYTEQDKDQYGRTQADKDWEKGINPKTDKKNTAQDSATVKKVVNLKMDSEVGEPVTVEYDPKKNLTDVTISWGNESHTVDFEAGDVIDDHGNEGAEIETMADSDDGRWQFILDVQVEATYPMTGDFADWDFDELIVQGHPENEDHLDPEDRFDQDPMEEGLENQTLVVTSERGTVVLITDPGDIKAFLAGEEVYGEDQDGGSVEVSINNAQDHQMTEGSCGYGPNGVPGDTPGGTRGIPADKHTMNMMREVIKKEIAKLSNPKKADLDKDGKLSSYEKTRGAAIEKNIGKR